MNDRFRSVNNLMTMFMILVKSESYAFNCFFPYLLLLHSSIHSLLYIHSWSASSKAEPSGYCSLAFVVLISISFPSGTTCVYSESCRNLIANQQYSVWCVMSCFVSPPNDLNKFKVFSNVQVSYDTPSMLKNLFFMNSGMFM